MERKLTLAHMGFVNCAVCVCVYQRLLWRMARESSKIDGVFGFWICAFVNVCHIMPKVDLAIYKSTAHTQKEPWDKPAFQYLCL